jgi:hypothetical protein
VSWPIDAGQGNVTVDAVHPVNPAPQHVPASSSTSATPAQGAPRRALGTGAQGPRLDEQNVARTRMFGPPDDQPRIKAVTTPWGNVTQCHVDLVTRFLRACERAARESTWKPAPGGFGVQGFVLRHIDRNPNKPYSLHSWALAWDFFSRWPNDDASKKGPEYAPDEAFRNAFIAEGFYAGADFRAGRKDFPHIEWASAPPPMSDPVIAS